jgi:hypothetical protein
MRHKHLSIFTEIWLFEKPPYNIYRRVVKNGITQVMPRTLGRRSYMVEKTQIINPNYDSGLAVWFMEKIGIEIVHYIVSGGIAYYAPKVTNRQFTTDGLKFFSPSEMRARVQADIDAFRDNDINDIDEYFDEYYLLSYCGISRKLTVTNYNMIIEMINANFINLRKVIFQYM